MRKVNFSMFAISRYKAGAANVGRSLLRLSACSSKRFCKVTKMKSPESLALICGFTALKLRVRPPGIEWKTGRSPKMGKNWPKNRKWPSARNGEKMAQKWRKNGIWGHFSIFCHFLGHFFPISGRGPLYIFWPIFSHFGFRPVFHSIPGGLTRKSQGLTWNPGPLRQDTFVRHLGISRSGQLKALALGTYQISASL